MKVTRDDIVCLIQKANVVSDVSVLRDSVRLSEQGVDSLGVFNILLAITEEYGVEVPDEDIDGLGTVSALVDYLNARM